MDNVNGNDNQPKQITIAIHMYNNIIGIREMWMRQKKLKNYCAIILIESVTCGVG